MTELTQYYQRIDKALKAGNATEHTHRRPLARLIESLGEDITATNEPKQIECGAPDFIVTRKSIPLGHIEAKDVGKNLDAVEKDEQLVRYLDALPNLILTDYLEFRWYVSGEHRMTAKLDPSNEESFEAVGDLLQSFLDAKIQTINSPRDLAGKMGGLARLMRNIIRRAFETEGKKGTLHSQLDGFRTVLIETLSEEEFADMYAQTICYGLFAARCNHDGPDPFTRQKAAYELPKTNPFLRELFGHIAGPELDERITWIVDDLAELLDRTNIARILEDFGKRTRREDPVVHFYETFLAEYDKTLRELRGVYYTPEPVVSYIVSSVDHILKNDFGLKDGIADTTMVELPEPIDGGKKTFPRVTILDPAVGTGTFLREVFSRIWEWVEKSGQKGAWSSYVAQFVLPRIFGFEFLMAPYAVCHMKLGLQLTETGYDFRKNERLRVYLTNTLEEAHEYKDLPLFHEALAREALEAGQAKQDYPVMVILGNPPYSGHSANKGKWIHELLRGKDISAKKKTHNYFEVDGEPLGERNPKWLNDDYVKFIRFAQWRIERTGSGILAFITNHGYLDNPTFRGMRQSLMETFDDIYVLDLHGNAKKKEKAPDGTKDENVFDIQQGVAIGIFVKKKNSKRKAAKVRHADLWGTRETYGGPADDQQLMGGKYHWLWGNDVSTTKWTSIKPDKPFYLFIQQDTKLKSEYDLGWRVPDASEVHSVGIATGHDSFVFGFRDDELRDRISGIKKQDKNLEIDSYNVSKSKISAKKLRKILDKIDVSDFIEPCLYRPFDVRPLFYFDEVIERPRSKVMRHMLNKENISIIISRLTKGEDFAHVQCSRHINEVICMSPKTSNNGFCFPVYLYPPDEKTDLFDDDTLRNTPGGRRPNLSPEFIDDFEKRLKLKFIEDGKGDLKKTFGPEDVLAYMYAVFHSPAFRKRYREFLRIDFPRLPLTSDKKLFRSLCKLGDELTGLHLLKKYGQVKTSYPVEGDDTVKKVKYAEPKGKQPGRVWINDTQYFENVPAEVWAFHIGGYPVAGKWLKDRKGRKLEYKEDIEHYQRVIAALTETMRLMIEIDAAIDKAGGWPIQ